jgi:hypothetical protein
LMLLFAYFLVCTRLHHAQSVYQVVLVDIALCGSNPRAL